jgi:hypothetical protein
MLGIHKIRRRDAKYGRISAGFSPIGPTRNGAPDGRDGWGPWGLVLFFIF